MSDTHDELADIKALVIEPEEITDLVQEMARRHQDGEQPDLLHVIAQRFHGNPDKAICIHFRLGAFIPLLKDDRMRGWSFEDSNDPDCLVTNNAIFRGVAKCPLRSGAKRMSFDPDEFFNIVLKESDSEGMA